MRIAFVGQGRYFLATSFQGRLKGSIGKFFDLDSQLISEEHILSGLVEFRPNVIVVYRPDFFERLNNLIYDLQIAPVVGFFTEPVGKRTTFFVDNLRQRRQFLKNSLKHLKLDYHFCFTDDLAEFVSRYALVSGVMPLPVNDKLYSQRKFDLSNAKIIFLGRMNVYRSNIVDSIKHEYNPIVIDNGLGFDELESLIEKKSAIALNIHVGKLKSFEHRVLGHMALGHLVISQPLIPDFGFLPDCEYISFDSSLDLVRQLEKIRKNPEWATWIANRGIEMVKRHKASEIWSQLGNTLVTWDGIETRKHFGLPQKP